MRKNHTVLFFHDGSDFISIRYRSWLNTHGIPFTMIGRDDALNYKVFSCPAIIVINKESGKAVRTITERNYTASEIADLAEYVEVDPILN